jgi:hypothetical protein
MARDAGTPVYNRAEDIERERFDRREIHSRRLLCKLVPWTKFGLILVLSRSNCHDPAIVLRLIQDAPEAGL